MDEEHERIGDGRETISEPTRRARAKSPSAPSSDSELGARTPTWVDPSTAFTGPGERRYRHRRVLGRGGMGEVKLVDDERIGRSVAVKTLHDEEAENTESVGRFLREARVQGQLEHPSIVPVYDVDHDDRGRAFFTMRRIDGDTLERILTRLADGDETYRRVYSRRKLLSIFQSICLALEYAHASGVVHRDLKPSNIMIGNFGEVHVLDWGIARVHGVRDAYVTSAAKVADAPTQRGTVLGTPGFMAPEQISDAASADARSDVYALGALLFAMLTYQSLHRGDADERVRSTERGADARASVRAPIFDIAPELDAICVRATAARPEDRYGSARALHDAVERFLEGDRDEELRARLAEQQLEEGRRAAQGALAPLGVFSLVGIFAIWTIFGWLGIRSTAELYVLFGSIGVAAVHALYVGIARPRAYRFHATLLTVPVSIAVGASSALFGPLFLTPMLALVVVAVASVIPGLGRARWVPFGLLFLAVLLPFVGEWLGLLPPSYAFENGRLVILPRAVAFPETQTRIALFLANVSITVVMSAFLFRSIAAASSTAARRDERSSTRGQ